MTEIECEAVLFDCDGVLVDSRASILASWTSWADRRGLDRSLVLGTIDGPNMIEIIRQVAPHLVAEEEAVELRAWEVAHAEGTAAIPGSTLVRGLPRDRWAVVTSGNAPVIQARLRAASLPMPDVLVTAEDVRAGKPSPDGYLMASEKIGVAPDRCMVFEDAPAGVAAALRAGMRVVALATTHEPSQLDEADACVPDMRSISVIVTNRGLRVHVRNGSRQ